MDINLDIINPTLTIKFQKFVSERSQNKRRNILQV